MSTYFVLKFHGFHFILQLTSLLAEIGLNIREAHAFSTTDGYSLDVFVVDGWPYEVCSQSFHNQLVEQGDMDR